MQDRTTVKHKEFFFSNITPTEQPPGQCYVNTAQIRLEWIFLLFKCCPYGFLPC